MHVSPALKVGIVLGGLAFIGIVVIDIFSTVEGESSNVFSSFGDDAKIAGAVGTGSVLAVFLLFLFP